MNNQYLLVIINTSTQNQINTPALNTWFGQYQAKEFIPGSWLMRATDITAKDVQTQIQQHLKGATAFVIPVAREAFDQGAIPDQVRVFLGVDRAA